MAKLPTEAVLFDRDGTLVEDLPYDRDPALVRPRPGARAALDRLREQPVAVWAVCPHGPADGCGRRPGEGRGADRG